MTKHCLPVKKQQRALTLYLSALNLLARAAKKAVFTVPVSLVSAVLRNRQGLNARKQASGLT